MGLSIHYKLTVPASTESRLRRQMLAQLRQAALDLPFQAVSDLEVARGRQCDYSRLDRNDPQIWFLMTTLRCNRCEKPICPKFAVLTPTG